MLSADGGASVAEPIDAAAFAALMAPWRDAGRLLVAVSGGPDSVALMGLAAGWGRHAGVPVAVATVDHGLRPESRGEARGVAGLAAALGLEHAVLAWSGPALVTRIQERARLGRYGLLTAHARAVGATHLATAHTLDDQAETILYRLARGSGATGLVGMRACVSREGVAHVRPLLGVRKAALVATCRANAWPFVDDPSNADPRFARTRWRRLLSVLEPEGLGPERLAAFASRLRRLEAAVDWSARAAHAAALLIREDGRVVFDGRKLAGVPDEVFLRVVAKAVQEAAPRDASRHLRLRRLERLCRELQRAVGEARRFGATVGGAIVAARGDGTIVLTREARRRGMLRADCARDRATY